MRENSAEPGWMAAHRHTALYIEDHDDTRDGTEALLRLHDLDVLAVDGADVTVEAGIRLSALGEELASRGLALENQGDVDAQTLAGAISTATHGTGGRFANISSRIVGMRIVNGTGEAVDVTGEDLRAARVGLGALGVISTVTVRCVPAFRIHRIDEPRFP